MRECVCVCVSVREREGSTYHDNAVQACFVSFPVVILSLCVVGTLLISTISLTIYELYFKNKSQKKRSIGECGVRVIAGHEGV